jgi:hypothetical protein
MYRVKDKDPKSVFAFWPNGEVRRRASLEHYWIFEGVAPFLSFSVLAPRKTSQWDLGGRRRARDCS